eukprot:3462569-Amphidinium_carterae.1
MPELFHGSRAAELQRLVSLDVTFSRLRLAAALGASFLLLPGRCCSIVTGWCVNLALVLSLRTPVFRGCAFVHSSADRPPAWQRVCARKEETAQESKRIRREAVLRLRTPHAAF